MTDREYNNRVAQLEREGLTRSDAQGVADAEMVLKGNNQWSES